MVEGLKAGMMRISLFTVTMTIEMIELNLDMEEITEISLEDLLQVTITEEEIQEEDTIEIVLLILGIDTITGIILQE